MPKWEGLFMSNLYSKIETLCVEHNITVYAMCKALGWRPSVMTELKAGRCKSLSVKKIQQIATYFEIPITDLLDEKENESTPKYGSELITGTDYMKLNKANKKKVDEMIEMLLKLQSLDE